MYAQFGLPQRQSVCSYYFTMTQVFVEMAYYFWLLPCKKEKYGRILTLLSGSLQSLGRLLWLWKITLFGNQSEFITDCFEPKKIEILQAIGTLLQFALYYWINHLPLVPMWWCSVLRSVLVLILLFVCEASAYVTSLKRGVMDGLGIIQASLSRYWKSRR